MSTHLLHRIRKRIRIALGQPGSVTEYMCTVAGQVNLLTLLVLGCITIGFLTRFFSFQSISDKTIAGCSLLMLGVVIALNASKKYQFANVLFYVSLNMISLVTLRNFPGQPAEAVLMYVFLLSLVVFLFQNASTRLICMSIVLFRIIFFELNVKYISHPNDWTFPIANEQARLAYDGILIALIVLVFILYGIKIYTVEKIKNKNSLFSQHMSHDLQTSYYIVASIISYLDNVSGKDWRTDKYPILFKELTNASAFYSYILNNFLEFSRYENSQIESNFYEDIDLAFELENIIDRYKYMADKKGIRITLLVDDHLPGLILLDKIKITRIMLNLLTNAINNTDSGKMITVSVAWKNGPWELSVANEGGEMSSEQLQHLFTPYESKKNTSGKGRLGLGLPITKQLVEALGGSITAMSQKNHETRFIVAFP